MNRRHFLKVLGLGSLSSTWSHVAGGWSGTPTPPAVVLTLPATVTAPSAPAPLVLFDIGGEMVSLCIGLGLEAEALIRALQTLDRDDDASAGPGCRNTAGLDSHLGLDPVLLAAWSADAPLHSVDLIVLVIDARDPRACDASRFWTARLADVGYSPAVILGAGMQVDQDADVFTVLNGVGCAACPYLNHVLYTTHDI